MSDYVWPYSGAGGSHAVYRNAVDRQHVSQVNLLLNEIPAGGEVDILVSPIRSLPTRRAELVNPSLEIAGAKVTFPVTLQSGQYMELESMDDCMLYDERGELIRRFRPQVDRLPTLAEGENTLRFDCARRRASARGPRSPWCPWDLPFGNRRADASIDWGRLDREYEIPRVVTRPDGRDNVWTIVRRADRPADWQGSLRRWRSNRLRASPTAGEASRGRGSSGGLDNADPDDRRSSRCVSRVRLTAGQRLVCRDQATWRVFDADGAEAASGRLTEPFPPLAPGTNPIKLDFQRGRVKLPRCRQDRESLSLIWPDRPSDVLGTRRSHHDASVFPVRGMLFYWSNKGGTNHEAESLPRPIVVRRDGVRAVRPGRPDRPGPARIPRTEVKPRLPSRPFIAWGCTGRRRAGRRTKKSRSVTGGKVRSDWSEALPMRYNPIPNTDEDLADYRGSIVHLAPATTYEIQLTLAGTRRSAQLDGHDLERGLPRRRNGARVRPRRAAGDHRVGDAAGLARL